MQFERFRCIVSSRLAVSRRDWKSARHFRAFGRMYSGQAPAVVGPARSETGTMIRLKPALLLFTSMLVSLASSQTVIVDDRDERFVKHGPSQYWFQDSVGFNNNMSWTYTSDAAHGVTNWGEWRPPLPQAGVWRVSVYVPPRHATTSNAVYKISTLGGVQTARVDQKPIFSQWVTLGDYALGKDVDSNRVLLEDQTGEGWGARYMGFDAVRWVFVRSLTGPPPTAEVFDVEMTSASKARVSVKLKTSSFTSAKYSYSLTLPSGDVITKNGDMSGSIGLGDWIYIYPTIDFAAYGVPKFDKNVVLHVSLKISDKNGTAAVNSSLELLTPIILISGIRPFDLGRGGSNAFTYLQEMLKHHSYSQSRASYTSAYRSLAENSAYPTLHYLVYKTNGDNFRSQAAPLLSSLVDYALSKSWSSRVDLVGHSKGGLVARAYCQTTSNPQKVRYLITANTPHLGTAVAVHGLGLFYPDLRPGYPYIAKKTGYEYVSANADIDAINSVPIPSSIKAKFLYTNGTSTLGTFKDILNHYGQNLSEEWAGDGWVPEWSQRCRTLTSAGPKGSWPKAGRVWDNNNVQEIYMGTHGHSGSLESDPYIEKVFSFVHSAGY